MHIKVGNTIRHKGWLPKVASIVVTRIEKNKMYYDIHEPAYKNDHYWKGMHDGDGYYNYDSSEHWIVVAPSSNLKNKKEFVLWK